MEVGCVIKMAIQSRTVYVLFIITFNFVCFSSVRSEDPCQYHTSVNITSGTKTQGGYIHDGIVYSENQTFQYTDALNATHLRGCLCLLKNCTKKCCPIGQIFNRLTECVQSDDPLVNSFSPLVYSNYSHLEELKAHQHFKLIHERPCVNNSFLLNPYGPERENEFFLQKDGRLIVAQSESQYIFDHKDYCIEAWESNPEEESDDNWTTNYLALVCFEYDEEEDYGTTQWIHTMGMIISIPFLLVTFIVYAITPELKNLHGKVVMSYIFGLTAAYSALIADQILPKYGVDSDAVCVTLALVIYFSFMLSFFWLNVMCFDIWWTFRGFRVSKKQRLGSQRSQFFLYCLYAWGFSLFLTGICALMQFHPSIPKGYIRPEIGIKKCWFSEKEADMVYFYTPMILILICNLMLFIDTVYKILKTKQAIAVLRNHSRRRKDNERFQLFCKLFLIMGINWVADCTSFVVGGSQYYWLVTDFCNTIYGIFIFIIFMCKRKVLDLIIKRCKNPQNESTATTKTNSIQSRLTMPQNSSSSNEKSFAIPLENTNIFLTP